MYVQDIADVIVSKKSGQLVLVEAS